jgi:hypothetical protein
MYAILPAELVDCILDECDFLSLKALRGSDRYLNALTSPRVFEEIYIALFPYSLDNFCQLAKSSQARHVKKLAFLSDVLPNERSAWERARGDQSSDALRDEPKKAPSTLSENDLFEASMLARKEQNIWLGDDARLRFKEHFSLLPNIVEAQTINFTPGLGSYDEGPVWRQILQRTSIGPSMWASNEDTGSPRSSSRVELSGQALICLLEAVGYRATFAGVKHMRTLRLNTSFLDCPLYDFDPHRSGGTVYVKQRWASRWQHVQEGFKHLTEFSFRFTPPVSPDSLPMLSDPMDALLLRAILEPLHSATKLQSVHLHAPMSTSLLGSCVNPKRHRPPPVSHLHLSMFMWHADLYDILEHQGSRLQSLTLCEIAIHDLDRLSMSLRKLGHLKNLEIRRFLWNCYKCKTEFDFLHTDDDSSRALGEAIASYLLKKTTWPCIACATAA